MIKNILWEMDGTVFDTYPAMTYAVSKSLNEMGFSFALNVIDGLTRQSMDHCMETLARRFKLDLNLFRARFAKSYSEISPAKQPPICGVHEVCSWIHTQGGVNIIITYHRLRSTQTLLDFHELTPCFDGILSAEQGYPHKPALALIMAALEKHALIPAETLLVGDRELDIQAGMSAGIQTCLFGGAKLLEPADISINSYRQLLEILTKNKKGIR